MVKMIVNLFRNFAERFRNSPRRGYKICEATLRCGDEVMRRPCLVTLEIPPQSTIVYPLSDSDKRRCDFAKVTGIELLAAVSTDGYGDWEIIAVHNAYFLACSVKYSLGDTVSCQEPFDRDLLDDCASGIYFFDTESAAIDYCIDNYKSVWTI